jgi:methionine-rich copper-binding protein CopC
MRNSRTIRRVVAIVATVLIGALSPEIPRAETESTDVVASYPSANVVVDGSMVQISLRFEEPVDHRRSTLTLKSGQGNRQLRPRLNSAPNYLFGEAGGLAPGAYELEWTARLADGRSASGTIPFTVKPSGQQSTAHVIS